MLRQTDAINFNDTFYLTQYIQIVNMESIEKTNFDIFYILSFILNFQIMWVFHNDSASQFRTTTFQMLSSHVWPMTTVLG